MTGIKNEIIWSTTEMSLEKWVRIRPMGFESKKIMSALSTLSAIRLCILVVLDRTIVLMMVGLIILNNR